MKIGCFLKIYTCNLIRFDNIITRMLESESEVSVGVGVEVRVGFLELLKSELELFKPTMLK